MARQSQFTFQRELDLYTEAQKSTSLVNKFISQHQREEDQHPYGKMVYCHFHKVKEQTQNTVDKPFISSRERAGLPKRDQRCYFKDNSLRIYSRGGSEYIVPQLFSVEQVYPMENGVIVKVRYDREKLFFDPTTLKRDPLVPSQSSLFGARGMHQEYNYLTLTSHPLDDLHPLSILTSHPPIFEGQVSHNPMLLNLLQTPLELLHVSYKLPICVFYNPQSSQVIIGQLKHVDMMPVQQQDGDLYIRSIEPESRHPEIFNINREPKVQVQEVYSESVQGVPSKVWVSRGGLSEFEVNIWMYYSVSKRLEVYQADIRQLSIFKKVLELNQVQDVANINFIHEQKSEIDIIPYSTAKSLSANQNIKDNLDVQILLNRLKLIKKQTLLLDQLGRQVHIYQGTMPLLTIDLPTFFDSYLQDKTLLSKSIKVETLSHAHKSNVTFNFSNGQQKRITLALSIDDVLVKSIIKCSKMVLPSTVFESLQQDFYEVLLKANLELQSQGAYKDPRNELIYQDQLTQLIALICAIHSGDHSRFGFMLPKTTSNSTQQASTPTSSSGNSQQQMTPQPAQSSKNATPTQTLQTKILRSSTTSFGADSAAGRRKTTTNQAVNSQPSNFSQLASQQTSHLKQGILGRQASGGQTLSNQQPRKFVVASGGSALTSNEQAQPNLHLSQNPFADLLKSDFHRETFASNYSSLFPEDMLLLTAPAQAYVPQNDYHQTVAQPIHVSPTKATTPTKSSHLGQRTSMPKSAPYSAQNQMEKKVSTPVSPTHTTNAKSPTNSTMQLPQVQVHFKTHRSLLTMNVLNQVFSMVHLLLEDIKLNKFLESQNAARLAKALIELALSIDPYGKVAYIESYIKEYSQYLNKEDIEVKMKKIYKDGQAFKEGVEVENVPNLIKWLSETLKGQNQENLLNYPFPMAFERTRKIVRVYEILNNSMRHSYIHPSLLAYSQIQLSTQVDEQVLNGLIICTKGVSRKDIIDYREYLKSDTFGLINPHLFEKVLFTIREEGLDLEDIKKLPSIVSLPILEIIRYAKLFLQEIQTVPAWPDSLYKMIQREDILNNKRLFERKGDSTTANNPTLSKTPSLNRGFSTFLQGDVTPEDLTLQAHRNDMESLMSRMAAEYINEQGAIPIPGENQGQLSEVNSEKNGNDKIMDFLKNRFSSDTRYKEVTNFLNSQSELAIKLEHIQNRETMTEEQLNAERQKLLDKMFLRQLSKCIGRGALQFGTVQTLPTETLKVPKINQTGYAPLTETYMQVEFKDDASKDILQWPEFHNGVASAMKIALSFSKNRGHGQQDISQVQHTRNWIMYHKPAEPKYEHGGFCLAMGLLGQFDTLQPTDIYQHLKSTHDATTIGILLGRAASKIGSMDDHDTRTLCIHIPYLLPPTLNLEVSLAVQSAAVIGAGLLYKGTSNRLMTEMLLAQIGRKPLSDKAIEREGYALASGIALGLVNLGVGIKMQGLNDLKLDERLIRYVEGGKNIDLPQSMLSQNFNHDNTKCSSIKEGDMVNVHITSQGALIALALIHLKSGNKQIADSLLMPQTFYSLESVRPSFLLLKVLCKNLILWDEIECSQEWVASQIPMIINDIYNNDINTVEQRYQQKLIEDGIDYSTVSLCYVNIIAGAVFSIGFKFSGSGNKEAFNLVQAYCQFFKKLKIIQQNKDSIGMVHTNQTKNQVDKNTIETCLCVCAFAMSIIMAGTGDVDCFRTLRVLRKRFEHDMHYGYNMAINMSLGFLFLGSGAFTFSQNNLAIASLLCSLYPMFPQNPQDNRYHLQALRHFYVLAIESRLIQARDIDTGEFLNVQLEAEITDIQDLSQSNQMQVDEIKSRFVKITTPDIINGNIQRIMIKDEKYHDVNIRFSGAGLVDETLTKSTPHTQSMVDKRSKIFEQFDFQKIIYLKKRTTLTQNSNLDQKSTQDCFIDDQNDKHSSSISLIEPSNYSDTSQKQLVEDSIQFIREVKSVKDKKVLKLIDSFLQLNDSSTFSVFQHIEDVLLSQSRDNFSTLSPVEFFRLQDLKDHLAELLTLSYIPQMIKAKLQILKELVKLSKRGKSEFNQYNLELNLNTIKNTKNGMSNLFDSYYNFKRSTKEYKNFIKQNEIELDNNKENLNFNKAKDSLVKVLTNFPSILTTIPSQQLNFDLHEISLMKTVFDSIINQFRLQGPAEAELVKKYRFSKINGLQTPTANQYDIDINLVFTAALKQIGGDKVSNEVINDVLIPAFIMIDK